MISFSPGKRFIALLNNNDDDHRDTVLKRKFAALRRRVHQRRNIGKKRKCEYPHCGRLFAVRGRTRLCRKHRYQHFRERARAYARKKWPEYREKVRLRRERQRQEKVRIVIADMLHKPVSELTEREIESVHKLLRRKGIK